MNGGANPLPVRVPPGVADELKRVLDELSRVTGARSVAIARRDGLLIVHRLAPGQDPVKMAAIAAATVDASAGFAEALEQGEFEQVVIRCAKGTVLAADAGPDAVLIALYDQGEDLSLARFRLKATAGAIEKTLRDA